MVIEQSSIITITDKAAEKAKAILSERGVENGALRVFVVGGGCSGYQYGMAVARNREDDDNSAAIEWFANSITTEIWRNWNDLTTAHQAENAIEEIYNAARTELVRLLNLHGGTVEFGPGDVQPLTDQRLGQSEAWDLWLDHMRELDWWDNDDPRN